jgi:hypothetical protein
MPETPAESDPDREAQAAGAGDDGSGAVDEPTGGTPLIDGSAETQRRRWQSDLDRERAARQRAEAEVAQLKGTPVVSEKALTAAEVASIVRTSVRREQLVRDVVAAAPTQFPHADPALLADPYRFESPEELQLALKQSSDSNGARYATEREKIAAEIRAEYGIKLSGSAAGGGNASPPASTDKLTAAMVANAGISQLREMTDADLKALAHSLVDDD